MRMNIDQLSQFLRQRETLGIKPGLERVNRLLALVGNPQNKLAAVHIAGTNGKGSTLQYINGALLANGYQVGMFTSPSMEGLTGHILHNGTPISETTFLFLFETLYPAIQTLDRENMHPTVFEIITAMAMLYFADHVDLALIEAGMGGREDTTNCFTPVLSIITNIAFDHTAFLGDSLAEIASHKAGIIKTNRPVITGEINEEALQVIENEANQKQASIFRMDKEFSYSNITQDEQELRFFWECESTSTLKTTVTIKKGAFYQVNNASLALMALKQLQASGIRLDWDNAVQSFHESCLNGRFEHVSCNPDIIIDGAHNPAGMQAFLQTVERQYAATPKCLLFAGFRDKNLHAMISAALPYFDEITITTFDHKRAASLSELQEVVNDPKIRFVENWQEAININNPHVTQFICGSLYFIKIVREFLVNK
ncbi:MULTISPECIES: folylpolyglutamate synthase/dihydrofolate synthase family protein [unclassified Virgibacillus]|uniref:bifunctional folylpolyglutamate synthase/dihydrofolate synthase n=1 Tax=unclassified Virgibacillus TaxID=2620237 RepID=UPI0024DE1146|nr:folylpolyglutamate synthase/dihydrofolate synthase family protein [Virgibacillus sp. LDC-1]